MLLKILIFVAKSLKKKTYFSFFERRTQCECDIVTNKTLPLQNTIDKN